ncbi:long-chain-alcohol oxidase FAO4A-like [Phoenix dactylifera]|uniref:Long-chain-alcohol oxidase n=1 Tax=Phoenix dactylifera TaxID=42345 RepID=A0A8B7BHN2_PHODC|nr:long-chain-alcohol oxidase FAO4A-like [Phoenix dactylifera]
MAEQRVHDLGARHEHIDEVKSSVSASKKWNLRGGRPTHPNLLSKREMDSLTAACDAFLPSVDVSDTGDEGLIAFYGTSASMAGTPERIGGLLSGGMQHPAIGLLRLALWLLSTWYGTFILCGRASLSNQFPYLQKFPQVRREKQEEILLSWSRSSLRPLKMLYKCLKYLTMKEYFSQINDKETNPSWDALGYCGPDPELADQSQHFRTPPLEEDSVSQEADSCPGPLDSALLYMDSPRDVITRKLQIAGFPTPTSGTNSPSSPLTLHCDVVVVGSGSGGSVVAGVLAKAGHRVIVVEKGHYYHRSELSLLEGPTIAEMYEGGGIISTDDIGVILLAGSTVGGGSTVNWSACIRTPDHVRNEWCNKLGLRLFGSEAYDHALDVVCGHMGVQSDVEEEGFNNAILRKGCVELGYPVSNVPRNAPPDHCCGWCHLGCKSARKKSTQETWLVDLAGSGNGLILPRCKALKVLHRKKKKGVDRSTANGVIVRFGSREDFIIESKVTVVACGALNTPGLLKRSGLRNANVGKNLHLHPAVLAWGYFPPARWPEEPKKSYEGGILTAMSTALASYDILLETPALHPGMFAVATPWISAADFRERMTRFSRTAHVFALVRDKGSGTTDYPHSLTYGMDAEDEEKLKKGVEAMVRILAAAGAEEVGTLHCKGERVRVGEEGGVEWLVKEVRRRGLRDGGTPVSTAHQMGSCRMGTDARTGAVSPTGEVWEVEGLFVADTSVFPTALGVNPMVTAQAIAYCTAQSILEFLEQERKL